METTLALPPKQQAFGATQRKDPWFVQPLIVFLGFSAFIVYSTWSAFQGTNSAHTYFWFGGGGANYLSPFYSPQLFGSIDHPGIFGSQPLVVACLPAVFSRISYCVDSGRLSLHLLLLPRRLL